jgi:hypothetical protein
MPKVTIRVEGTIAEFAYKGIQARRWTLFPYAPEVKYENLIYVVPIYRVSIVGKDQSFAAIRFGLNARRIGDGPKKKLCDVGLFKEQTHTCRWLPDYKLHSVEFDAKGAWKITGSFLIHAGSPRHDMPFGSFGCIEIIGQDEWTRFVTTVESAGGMPSAMLSQKGLVSCVIKPPKDQPWAELWLRGK